MPRLWGADPGRHSAVMSARRFSMEGEIVRMANCCPSWDRSEEEDDGRHESSGPIPWSEAGIPEVTALYPRCIRATFFEVK